VSKLLSSSQGLGPLQNALFARPQGALADATWEEEHDDDGEEEEEEGPGPWLVGGRPFWWSSGMDVHSKVLFLQSGGQRGSRGVESSNKGGGRD